MLNNKESRLDDEWTMGGNDFPLEFELEMEDGRLVALRGSTITWTLSYIGQKDSPILVKSSTNGGITITGVNTCKIHLTGEDTMHLDSCKYEHELTIVQADGRVLRPSYGYIEIRQGSIY